MGKYSVYTRATPGDKVLKEFPGLRKKDLDTADSFFKPYLFFENVTGGRRVWTSCCHHDGDLWKVNPKMETPRQRTVMGLKHNDECECPYCHRSVTAKNVKQMGTGKRLKQYIPILFLHTSRNGQTVYAQGYWAMKSYESRELRASPPRYMVTSVYRFRRGEWIEWTDRWCGGSDKYNMVQDTGKWIGEPFTSGSWLFTSYCDYRVIGLDCLEKSFLQYTGVRELYKADKVCEGLIRHLALAAQYPEGVEMLRKAGMVRPIDDWVWNRKKNTKVIKWDETDPRKVFGLDGRELREFLAGSKSLEVLEAYKGLRKRDKRLTFQEVEDAKAKLGISLTMDVAKIIKRTPTLPLRKLLPYFEKIGGPRCYGAVMTASSVAEIWRDYIGFARTLEYDLTNPVIFAPRDLELKHMEAAQSVAALTAGQDNGGVIQRFDALATRYGFETEHYLIRPPLTAGEIVTEGKVLCHCVGGFAGRHAKGEVTILFLRDKKAPEEPLCTIEMRGKDIVQIHGYRNDAGQRVTPKEKYQEILEPWLAWVGGGSKRDKAGRPKLPKKQKEVNAA